MSRYLAFLYNAYIVFSFWCVVCLGIWGDALMTSARADVSEHQSLYERLGGYNMISDIVDEFLVKMWNDPLVGRYFVGMGTDTREQLRQKNKLLMCKNTGGPCKIINRNMKVTHSGLGITESDWNVAVTHLSNVLQSLKVEQQEQQELLHLIVGLKEYIVEHSEE
ncbi:MAG: group I truncated hemoglobin [Nitrospirales bacterium]